MLLAIDLGNTCLKGAFFKDELLFDKFIINSNSDLSVLLDKLCNFSFSKVLISSVVPSLNQGLRDFFEKHFKIIPVFTNELEMPLKILLPHPEQVGADLLAGLIGANKLFPDCDLIVMDVGTIITFTILSSKKEVLGAIFFPCKEIIARAMHDYAEQLPLVKLENFSIDGWGIDTDTAIYSGLYYGQKGAIQEIIFNIRKKLGAKTRVIVTGGRCEFLEKEYDHVPNLIFIGLSEWWKYGK